MFGSCVIYCRGIRGIFRGMDDVVVVLVWFVFLVIEDIVVFIFKEFGLFGFVIVVVVGGEFY